MSGKTKKQFGVWMDHHHATITGRRDDENPNFVIIGRVSNPGADKNTNENAEHNHERALTHKFFKEIAAQMINVDEVHVTGTGQAQEQFIKFLAETPQYKNAVTSESTSNRMSDDMLVTMIANHFQ
jgi:stalled ribosome rescue protein Dom34